LLIPLWQTQKWASWSGQERLVLEIIGRHFNRMGAGALGWDRREFQTITVIHRFFIPGRRRGGAGVVGRGFKGAWTMPP